MDNIYFRETGIEIVRNDKIQTFIPYFVITEITNCKCADKEQMSFDDNLLINPESSLYVKYWYFKIITNSNKNNSHKIFSDILHVPLNVYKPAKFKDIFNNNETYPTLIDWMFRTKYITNPDIENFDTIYKKELEEQYNKLNQLRNKLISEYSNAITKYFTMPLY